MIVRQTLSVRNAALILAVAAVMPAGGCGEPKKSQTPSRQTSAALKPPAARHQPAAAPPPRLTKQTTVETPKATAPEPANRVEKNRVAVPAPVDERRVASHGIRQVQGDRFTLYTDLPPREAIDRLPDIFALAAPQWRRYFQLDESELAGWRVRGCLMKDRQRFLDAGLLPGDLEFDHAFAQDDCIWWDEQETDYYRRHLMLHEGTHAFVFHHFGDCGPAWYMEGLAELLGTHHLSDGVLTLGYFPVSSAAVPLWGRIKLVQDAVQAGNARSIAEIMSYQADAELETLVYAWCWALCAFLDGHPRYRDRFRQLPGELKNADFNRRFLIRMEDDWQWLHLEWQAFLANLDFGYDLARNAIEPLPAEPLMGASKSVTIAADRGWQSSGIHVEAGERYQLTATGRYQVAKKPKTWWCEPPGVTIRYYRGRPLGMLLAAIVPDDDNDVAAWRGTAIGASAELAAEHSGTLYLRINDAPGELSDNAGSLEVRVSAAGGGR